MTSKAHNNPINILVLCDDMKIGKFIINSYSDDDEVLNIEVGKKNIISAGDARDIAIQYLVKIDAIHTSLVVTSKYVLSSYSDKNDFIEVVVVKKDEEESPKKVDEIEAIRRELFNMDDEYKNAVINWRFFITTALVDYDNKFNNNGEKHFNPSSYSTEALENKQALREEWITTSSLLGSHYINVHCCDTSNKELLSDYIVEMSIMISRTVDTKNYYFEVYVHNMFNAEVDEIELYSIMIQIALIKGWFNTYKCMETFAGREEYLHFIRTLLQHFDKRFMLIDSIKDTAIVSKRSGSEYPGFLCNINNTTATRASPDEMKRRVSDINIKRILTIPLYPKKY